MGLNIAGDMKLQNYLRHILGMPDLDEETFESVYQGQTSVNNNNAGDSADEFDDTAENDFEQNDLSYTGSGGE